MYRLDFVTVALGFVSLGEKRLNFSVIRAVRVLRILRNNFVGMRIVLAGFRRAFQRLPEVVLLLAFFFIVFSGEKQTTTHDSS